MLDFRSIRGYTDANSLVDNHHFSMIVGLPRILINNQISLVCLFNSVMRAETSTVKPYIEYYSINKTNYPTHFYDSKYTETL